MNNKAMVIVAVAAVIVAVFAGLPSIQTVDAADETITSPQLGTASVSIVPGGESAAILLKVSEAEYVPLGYTLTWYVTAATSSDDSYSADFSDGYSLGSRSVTASTNIETVEAFVPESNSGDSTTFTMSEADGLGNYILEVNCVGEATDGTYAIKCVVEVNVSTGDSATIPIPPVYGIVNTTVEDEIEPGELNGMGFVIGVPSMAAVSSSDGDVLATGKTWYATGLPQGLSMSPSGIVSGMPTGKDLNGSNLKFLDGRAIVTVSVYSSEVTDGSVKITEYELEVTINKSSPSAMTITLSSEESGFKEITESSSIYSAVHDTDVTLEVSVDDGSTLDVIAVTAIGDGGTTRLTYSDGNGATFTTSGAGQYHIVVNAVVDGSPVTGYVTLNVVSELDSLQNSIVIDGA